MTQHAMSISISARALLAGTALAMLTPVGAGTQVIQRDPDMEDIARTPLNDLNIDSEEISEVLRQAAADPYASDGLGTCNDIVTQVAQLDTVLGADFDIADEEKRRISEGRVAQSVIGSFIPFRGIVREVTGANARDQERTFALTAGMVRRAFLKGLGQGRGCDYPARPREVRGTLTADGQ